MSENINELKAKIQIITPQPTNENNAVIVEDYPYGFTTRTKARYWIETTKNGEREVFQTLNPRTQNWNKPKKSTYSDIVILYRDTTNNHINGYSLHIQYSGQAELDKFLALFDEKTLSEYQQKRLAFFKAIIKARKHVKISMVVNPTPEEQARIDQHEKEFKEWAPKAVNYYLHNPDANPDLTQEENKQ